MIALVLVLVSLIAGGVGYMEWDNRKHWQDGRKLSRTELAHRKLAENNPFLEHMLVVTA